ncbi:hypothetical protein QYF61_011745 [Mycteria americana]|uniref:Uncharacterized protein n=1 Tax=Mycteria americana TaxID=33587 RepID=A0AAN7S750_MYCAM|nr:hypothetical protein QYF61_011745 [Mycteria americana]
MSTPPPLVTGTVVTPTPATGTVAEPGNQPVLVSVTPIHKKKSWKQNHRPAEHSVTWLLQCWDNRASSLELEGKEAKQLGSLSREGGIDKAIGKGAQTLSLWRSLLSAIKERYSFKEDVMSHPGKWTTMERGIQYLRELAVLEVIYDDLNNEQLPKDPDEVKCTRPMWWKLVQNTPASYANSLQEGRTVDEAASQLREYEESISSSFISAVEKLVQQLKEDRSYSPPVRTSVSAIRSQRSSAQQRVYRGYTPRGTLWFYLPDHKEDMRKWEGKSISTLEAWVRELQGKKSHKGVLPGKLLLQFPVGSSPDRVENLILLLILMKELLTRMYKEWVTNAMTRTRGALPPARWRKGTTGFTGLWGFDGLAHQSHRSIRL